MPVVFSAASLPPLDQCTVTAPDGAVIGVIGENGSGIHELALLAAGQREPTAGQVTGPAARRYLGPLDALNLSPVQVLAIEHTIGPHDALVRARTLVGVERLRRGGATVFLVSHEQDLLRNICDEVWWLHEGRLQAKGDPRETLDQYNAHLSARLRSWGETIAPSLMPSLRRGDGRARLVGIETLNEAGQPASVWQAGAPVAVRVKVKFEAPVEDPVVGIMIRTRIGFEVYGTNTQLERVKLGPCSAGDERTIIFQLRCDLCAQEYSLTAASHDPDGVWHDWMEDAIAFSVTDTQYRAGVANLGAKVTVFAG